AELLAGLEPAVVAHPEVLDLVAEALERALGEEVLGGGEAADEERDVIALLPLHGEPEHVVGPLLALGLEAQPLPLRLLEGAELGLDVDVEVGARGAGGDDGQALLLDRGGLHGHGGLPSSQRAAAAGTTVPSVVFFFRVTRPGVRSGGEGGA